MTTVGANRSIRPIIERGPRADTRTMSQHRATCNLCGDLHGHVRPGRLGRYSRTCDSCESRRGAHLVKVGTSYASRDVHEAALV